ncbi:MAG: hypothetical protein HS104_40980 [Polyangiaceae bacterium]|nr:hypothetical protein [Polyangiaceae bacterium]MCL4755495.1 hypothetical protein [Myxococcales bacterium]
MSTEEELASRLGSLPTADVDGDVARRIGGRARVVLGREARLAKRPALRRASRFYDGAVEPALVATACFVYLWWALDATMAIFR